jgi:hypothetical protein
MRKLKQGLGNVVTGDRFWGREKDVALFMERIDSGAHQLLVAQRRMGKTSLMAEAARRFNERGKDYCVFVDFQGARSSADAIAELSMAIRGQTPLWEKVKGLFVNVLGKISNSVEAIEYRDLEVKLRSGLTAGNWANKGEQLFDILAGSDKPVVLMFDEVPIMINHMVKENNVITTEGREKVDVFLSWMRKNSIKHQGKIRIVLSGSIGLEPVLKEVGLIATVNNFVPFELKAWDKETAIGCLEALANQYGVNYKEGAMDKMVELLGCCIPHYVQMFFTHTRERCERSRDKACSVEDVVRVYNEDVLGVRGDVIFSHYEVRLKQFLGEKKLPLALEMVTEATVGGGLSSKAIKAFQEYYTFEDKSVGDVEQEILWVLEHDGYLKWEGDGYMFVSNVLRDWWERRHGSSYTPVLQRKGAK